MPVAPDDTLRTHEVKQSVCAGSWTSFTILLTVYYYVFLFVLYGLLKAPVTIYLHFVNHQGPQFQPKILKKNTIQKKG